VGRSGPYPWLQRALLLGVGQGKVGAMRGNIALSSGRTIEHSPMPNGATEANVVGGREMSDEEWGEYCRAIKAEAPTIGNTGKPMAVWSVSLQVVTPSRPRLRHQLQYVVGARAADEAVFLAKGYCEQEGHRFFEVVSVAKR
jgi:hypothetical protein